MTLNGENSRGLAGLEGSLHVCLSVRLSVCLFSQVCHSALEKTHWHTVHMQYVPFMSFMAKLLKENSCAK